jgi:hypothetical protein
VPDQLVANGVDDRHFAFEDRDERIGPIADSIEQRTGWSRALFADLGKRS